MARYLPAAAEPPRVDRHRIPGGLAGTRTTAAHVARLIRDGAGDFYVRQKAIDILLAHRIPAKDYVGEIDALFQWVQRHVRYTKDPYRIEVLHSARRMLALRAGDCDDMTIVLGALLKSVGHPVRIVLTGPDPRRPDVFSHIYLEAGYHDQWIPLDATMPHGLGWSPRTPVRQVLSIEEERSDVRTALPSGPATAAARATADAVLGLAGAPPRMAAGSVARRPPGRRAATRCACEGAVGSAAPPPAARRQPVGTHAPALHLGQGAGRAASAADHGSPGGAAQIGGRALGAAAAAIGARTGRVAPVDAAPSTGGVAPGRDAATSGPAAAAPPDRVAAPRPLSDAVRSGAALYRQFTRFPAGALAQVAHARLMPPVVVELGQLAGLVYRSSKWVGRPRTYIHFMDDPPRLVSDVTGRRLFIVGGSYRVTPRGIEG